MGCSPLAAAPLLGAVVRDGERLDDFGGRRRGQAVEVLLDLVAQLIAVPACPAQPQR